MDACLRCQAESKVDARSLGTGAGKDCVVSMILHWEILILLTNLNSYRTDVLSMLNSKSFPFRSFGENVITHFITAV